METPEDMATRPTADRAREALFSILAADLSGARFLDLFCGSGAMGIEALSRGAKWAVFVDEAHAAIKCTTANLDKTKLAPRAKVLNMSAAQAISEIAEASEYFDIVFLDPPYGSGILIDTLEHLASVELVTDGGFIIAETESDKEPEPEIDSFSFISDRVYGRTKFLIFRKDKRNDSL